MCCKYTTVLRVSHCYYRQPKCVCVCVRVEGFLLPTWPPFDFPSSNNNNFFVLCIRNSFTILCGYQRSLSINTTKCTLNEGQPLNEVGQIRETHFVDCGIWDWFVGWKALGFVNCWFLRNTLGYPRFHYLSRVTDQQGTSGALMKPVDSFKLHENCKSVLFQHVQTERQKFYTTLPSYCDGVQVSFQATSLTVPLGLRHEHFPPTVSKRGHQSVESKRASLRLEVLFFLDALEGKDCFWSAVKDFTFDLTLEMILNCDCQIL